jgi:dynactin complex subunit
VLVPDLTFRDDIKLNPRLRLHGGCGTLASLAPDIAPFGITMARSSRQDIRRGDFVYAPQRYELHLANKPDDDRFDLVEMRRQITNLRSQHSDNLLATSRLNRFLVKVAFLSEPIDAAHEQHLKHEFVRTLRSVEAIVSRGRSAREN